ncbi:MAG: phosphodiester glycosidase family protein [Elusimicrobiota bacterium]|jgi:hypothetical protein
MRKRLRGRSALILALVLSGSSGCASAPRVGDAFDHVFLESRSPGAKTRAIRPGVSYSVWNTTSSSVVHVLAVDLSAEGLSLRPVLGHDVVGGGPEKREPLLSMAQRTGALAMINADYFTETDNIEGLTVIDGKVLLDPDPPGRSSVVIGKDRRVWVGKNSPRRNPELDYEQAVGGGPKIVENGIFRWDVDEQGGINGEAFKVPKGRWDQRHSLTALCVDRRRIMFWVVVHGDKPAHGAGMTPWELAPVLKSLGCWEGIRLDGGRSSGMVIRGRLVSASFAELPEGRPVGCALGLFER